LIFLPWVHAKGSGLLLEAKMEFEVKDMSCDGCANSITRAVTNVDPAAKLDIDVTTKIMKIDSAMPPERQAAVVVEAGFHPTVNA
jgi:copper chaperone